MTNDRDDIEGTPADQTPGDSTDAPGTMRKYVAGFGLSIVLTLVSFWVAGTSVVWTPGVPILLAVLAIAQMGVHLVFFLHITSGAEGVNNLLALTFGIFVVALVVFGSMIIMNNLDANMMPMVRLLQMQR